MGQKDPPRILERALKQAETVAVMVGYDNSDNNLEIPEGS
jgi:nicotinamide mononucleotide adenylyltransferase